MKNETFTPERIKAEADAFFEWDGEDRSLVTTTSCLLFAQHIAGLMQARSAQPAPVVPEGYVLVPVEPTEAMRAAYEMSAIAPMGPISIYGYRAMLAAAPAQGQQGECQDHTQEAAEILRNMIDSIEKHGNYSQESTLLFLNQAYGLLACAAEAPTKGGDV